MPDPGLSHFPLGPPANVTWPDPSSFITTMSRRAAGWPTPAVDVDASLWHASSRSLQKGGGVFLLGVILVTLATLGALTAAALREGYRLDHPVATAAGLVGVLLLGAVLIAD